MVGNSFTSNCETEVKGGSGKRAPNLYCSS